MPCFAWVHPTSRIIAWKLLLILLVHHLALQTVLPLVLPLALPWVLPMVLHLVLLTALPLVLPMVLPLVHSLVLQLVLPLVLLLAPLWLHLQQPQSLLFLLHLPASTSRNLWLGKMFMWMT